jgi:hypothetical protein
MEHTPAPTVAITRATSSKFPDPPALGKKGENPTFESWEIQMKGKFHVNADRFEDEDAKMFYVFSCTKDDAQAYLLPRYSSSSANPWPTAQAMIDYLGSIFREANAEENARHEYNRIRMRKDETFADFYTKFLTLAGKGNIPESMYCADLRDKLTPDLHRAVISTYRQFKDYQAFADELIAVDQELKKIQEREERSRKFRNNNSNSHQTLGQGNVPTTARNSGTAALTAAPTRGYTPANTGPGRSHTTTPAPRAASERPRPQYGDARLQHLSDEGKCFNCGKTGHFSRDCTEPKKTGLVSEMEQDHSATEESGKE